MSRLLPKNVALTDRVLMALHDGPGTAAELAARTGTVACWCAQEGRVGRDHLGGPCPWCEATPGWCPARDTDVRPILQRLVKRGLANRCESLDGRVMYLPVQVPSEIAE